MNTKKLLRWNLRQPLDKRITAEQVAENAWYAGHKRRMNEIHRSIRAIVDEKIREREALWESL